MESLGKHTETDTLFEQLASANEEPVMAEARTEARIYSGLIDEEAADAIVTSRIINELNTKVGAFIGQTVTVTGVVRYFDIEDNELKEQFMEDVPAIFNGFAAPYKNLQDEIDSDDEEFDPETANGKGREIQYQLCVGIEEFVDPNLLDEDTKTATLFINTRLDSQIQFEAISTERAIHWLKVSYPEIMEDLEYRVLNSSPETEAHLFKRLRDINIDISKVEDYETLRTCLRLYINSIFPVDKDVPYAAAMNGLVVVKKDSGELAPSAISTVDRTELLLKFEEFVWIHSTEKGKKQLGLYMKAQLIAEEYTKANPTIYIPPDTIKKITSMRYAHYQS